MARIPDAELARIKAEVSVQRLAATSWVRVRSTRMTPRRWWSRRARTCGVAWVRVVGVGVRSTG